MRIVFLGSGNIAHFFASRLAQKGHEIVQVYSRNEAHARLLTAICGGDATADPRAIVTDADAYILAIRDGALAGVAASLRFPGKVLIHCAGAVPLGVMAGVSDHLAVIWALYSVKKDHLPQGNGVPLIVESSDDKARQTALQLAGDISERVLETDFTQRQMLHLNAVFANNFTNHLLAIAQRICEEHRLPFEILLPIIRQTLEQAAHILPAGSQTGPAVRHDNDTLARHLSLLHDHPEWQQVYTALSASIQQYNPSHS